MEDNKTLGIIKRQKEKEASKYMTKEQKNDCLEIIHTNSLKVDFENEHYFNFHRLFLTNNFISPPISKGNVVMVQAIGKVFNQNIEDSDAESLIQEAKTHIANISYSKVMPPRALNIMYAETIGWITAANLASSLNNAKSMKELDNPIGLKQINEIKKAKSIKELDNLIGLENIKEEVNSIINIIKVREIRKKHKLSNPDMSFHMVFSGNPGTGKTSVARVLAKIYKELGFLSKGHLVETDRSGLVAGYVGHTALKTKEVVTSAIGGILFIDEAYSLITGGENDFGREAIDTLIKLMEDNRDDLVVIVAGYTEEMQEFLNSNPGLKSRFGKKINFPDYSDSELMKIFFKMCSDNQYKISKNSKTKVDVVFKEMVKNKEKDFGNGREVRNYFERVISKQASRIVNMESPTKKDIEMLIDEDFE